MTQEKGRLTGWHVLIILGVFFGIMVTVNVIFTVFAVQTFPGEQVKKSYVQGLNYNQTLKDRERQTALGWRAEIGFEARDDGGPRLVSNWFDSSDEPMIQLRVTATLIRKVSESGLQSLQLSADGPGRYFADLSSLGPGEWRIEVKAESPAGESVTAEKTVSW